MYILYIVCMVYAEIHPLKAWSICSTHLHTHTHTHSYSGDSNTNLRPTCADKMSINIAFRLYRRSLCIIEYSTRYMCV